MRGTEAAKRGDLDSQTSEAKSSAYGFWMRRHGLKRPDYCHSLVAEEHRSLTT